MSGDIRRRLDRLEDGMGPKRKDGEIDFSAMSDEELRARIAQLDSELGIEGMTPEEQLAKMEADNGGPLPEWEVRIFKDWWDYERKGWV